MKNLLYIFIGILVYGCHDSHSNLGDSYIYDSRRIYKSGEKWLIPDQVLNYEYDKNYIIAYQKPDSAYFREFHIDFYKNLPDSTLWPSPEEIDSLEALLDSMLEIKDCYWIIRKEDCKLYGPMSESHFNRMCKKMNITIKMDKRYETQFMYSK